MEGAVLSTTVTATQPTERTVSITLSEDDARLLYSLLGHTYAGLTDLYDGIARALEIGLDEGTHPGLANLVGHHIAVQWGLEEPTF